VGALLGSGTRMLLLNVSDACRAVRHCGVRCNVCCLRCWPGVCGGMLSKLRAQLVLIMQY